MSKCCRCKKEIKSGKKYASIIDGSKLSPNSTEALKKLDNEVFNNALLITECLCADCFNDSIDYPDIKVAGRHLPLPKFSLGVHAQNAAKMAYSKQYREAIGKEVCFICSKQRPYFKISALYNNQHVIDWIWLCDTCIDDWNYRKDRLKFDRKKISSGFWFF